MTGFLPPRGATARAVPLFALFALLVAAAAACSPPGQARGTAETAGDAAPSISAAVGAATVSAGLAGAYPPGQPGESGRQPAAARRWTFDSARAGAAPAGFAFGRTGRGAPGRWVVQAAPDAPSGPHVLAQTDTDPTSDRASVAVAEAPAMRDGAVAARCKMVAGRVDQACGLVFRYRDAENYYVTRANALEDDVRLYTMRNGRRREIASWDGRVTPGAWHELRAEARGDQIRVFWDGRRVLEHRDATFPGAGRAGVWTKADSYTLYDDLTLTPSRP